MTAITLNLPTSPKINSSTQRAPHPLTPKNDAPRTAEPTSAGFRLDLEDTFTPDLGMEDMYVIPDNRFAFSPGQLSKLLNLNSLDPFFALGGLVSLEKGLKSNRDTGLSVEETIVSSVAFKGVRQLRYRPSSFPARVTQYFVLGKA